MRLIDADKLEQSLIHCDRLGRKGLEVVLETIKSQPTAFDVDKVLKELDEKSIFVATSREFYDHPQNGKYVAIVVMLDRAIDIVKRGGVE